MIEYYGWLNVRDNPHETDYSLLCQIVEEVRSIIEQIKFEGRILELKWMNGNCILCTAGSTNHRTKNVTNIIELFRTISKKAPGSYGVLYIYDDEDKEGTSDEFQIFKVAKGEFSEETDQLFSPCSLKIFNRTVHK